MSSTLSAKVSLILSSVLTSPNGSASVSNNVIDRTLSQLFAPGTGAGQADQVYSETRTIAASGSAALDLAGVLLDAFGNALTFARIKALIVLASFANTNDVLIGGAASDAWFGCFGDATDIAKVRPGGMAVFMNVDATGWPVTPTTGDQLKLANSGSGTSVTFDLVLLGASA